MQSEDKLQDSATSTAGQENPPHQGDSIETLKTAQRCQSVYLKQDSG